MVDHELGTYVFASLAELSHVKNQLDSRDRFLLLAAIAACRAGCLDIAERCRQMVLEHNSRHLIGNYDSIADALRDPDFAPFELSLNRFCSFEQAELLAARNNVMLDVERQSDAAIAVLDRISED